MKPRVWVDTDVALGDGRRDPDDAYALAALAGAHRRGEVTLLGLSTVFGNTAADRAAAIARRLLDVCGVALPLVEGARRAGETSAAARAIAELPDGAELLLLGPPTNLTRALALDKTLAGRLARVRLVGGNPSSRGRLPPLWPFEFNLAKDPAATDALFRAPLRRVVYPLDVARRLHLPALALARLARHSAVGAHLAAGSLGWLAWAPLRYRRLGFPLWDLLPALDVIGAIPVAARARPLAVRGAGLLVEGAPSDWVESFDPAAAIDALFARLA